VRSLVELAADAIEEAAATRERPLEFEAPNRHLAEDQDHTKAAPEGRVCAAASVDGPGGGRSRAVDEVIWWRTDDL
jgi:hypothetical protein